MPVAQVRDIKTAFAALKSEKITLEGNRAMTVKEAVFALAPTLERMKKHGFDVQEIAEKLEAKGIAVKPPTLAKYLAECRRKQARKADRPASRKQAETPPATVARPEAMPEPVASIAVSRPVCSPEGIVRRPDTPFDEL
jgi:hypothetical protein